jgi:membrane protein YdbS with pleckstrin-like domain
MATTKNSVPSVSPLTNVVVASTTDAPLYPSGVPDPVGAAPGPVNTGRESTVEQRGIGVEGEVIAWEGRYSMRNFVGRSLVMAVLTIAWAGLALYTWTTDHTNLRILTWVAGVVVLALWLLLARRVILARFGHFYELTNRRLFATTGVFNRRRDQIELLRVQDVYLEQNLWTRLLHAGTVVVVSSEPHFPVMYLSGVSSPKEVMDLIWHHARAERDVRSVKIDQI